MRSAFFTLPAVLALFFFQGPVAQAQRAATGSSAALTRAKAPLKQTQSFNCDFDDNIFITPVRIWLWDTVNKREAGVSTQDFAIVKNLVGKDGPWKQFALRDESFREFGDNGPDGPHAFRKQIERAIAKGEKSWQGPSWNAFRIAASNPETLRNLTLISARRHSPEHILEGLQVLVDHGYLPALPPLENIFPVGWPGLPERFKGADAAESKAKVMLSRLDDIEKQAVPDDAAEVESRDGGGAKEKLHLWGFSDDDFDNYSKAIEVLSKEVAKGRWPHVKVVLFFDGLNNPEQRPKSVVIKSDGTLRQTLPTEATRMVEQRGLLTPEAARLHFDTLVRSACEGSLLYP